MRAVLLLALALAVSGCSYLPPERAAPTGTSLSGKFVVRDGSAVFLPDTTTAPTTTTLEVKYVWVQRVRYQNKTLDLSWEQKKKVLDMRPEHCQYSAACSDGFDQAKGQCIEILGLPSRRYSERESANLFELYRTLNETWLPVQADNLSEYVRLNSSLWWIVRENDSILIRKI